MKDEKIFREKLYHHTVPVRDGLWEAIEAQLPPKEDRRAFPLFWFTLFGATLLGGALMIGLFTADDNVLSPVSKVNTSSQVDKAANLQRAEANSSLDQPTTPVNTNETSENSIGIPGAERSVGEMQKNKSPETAGSKNSNIKRGKNQVITFSAGHNQIVHDQIVNEEEVHLANAIPGIGLDSRNETNISLLPLSAVKLSNSTTEAVFNSRFKPDPNCYKFAGPGSKFAITADLFGGPGFSPKTYEDNSSDSNYADARKATESNQYAWSVGARINLHHRSGLAGRIGFTYTQAGDIFDYTDSLATQSTTRIDSFFAADGTFLYSETSQVLILGTLIKKIHNTYRYYDIPLILGYEVPLGRSTLMLNAGPVFNLTSSHEGQILDPMLHPRSITEGEPGSIDVYKTSLGLGIYLGAGMLFPLTDHLSGIVEPSFLYRLKPVTLDNYPLSEHRHYAGLNVGIRYHFN